MTKRIISLILSLAMVLSLFTGLSFTASAEEVYEKTTSIAVGDTVVLVCESQYYELNGISSTNTKYGIGLQYSTSPSGAFPLTVVEGAVSGTFAFKTQDEKYLYWNSGNSLNVKATLDQNTSWTVEFDAEGNATIKNVSNVDRKLQFNRTDPRFACYTSSQTAVQFYKPTGVEHTWTWNNQPGSNGEHTEVNELGETRQVPCTPDEGTTDPAPSCTAVGTKTYHCTVCGAVASTEEVPMVPHNYVNGVCTVCGAEEPALTEYVLADNIHAGDKVIFVSRDGDNAIAAGPLAGSGNSTYLSAVGALVNENTATSENALVFDVEVGTASGTFAFKYSDLYLTPSIATSKNNYVYLNTSEKTALADWTVSFASEIATVAHPIDETATRYLKYNAGDPRFSTYLSGQQDIAIYKLDDGTDLVDVYFVDQDQNAKGYVYAFGNGNQNADFPGVEQTPLCLDENGYNVYKVTLDRNTYTNVIFSGGASDTQTANLGLGTGGSIVYYVNGHTGYVGSDYWPQPPVEVAPTCTEPGTITYTGALTGETHVTTIPALGHAWGTWASNGDNTHSRVCANDPNHVDVGDCVDENGDKKCDVCYGDIVEVTSEYYVIAAKVGEQYFALPNTGSDYHPAGVPIKTVSKNGAFGVGDLTFERMKVRLTEAVVGSNQWTIDNGTHRLGANDANLVWQAVSEATTDAQRWTRNDNSDELASLVNVGANTRGLLYQDNSATVGENEQKLQRFGAYATSNLNTDTYFDVELLPLVESSEDIVIYFVDETGEETEAYYGTESPEDLTPPEVDKVSSIVDKGTDKNGNPYYKLVAPVITYKDNFIVTNGTDRSAEGYKAVHLDIVEDARQNDEGNYYVVYHIIEGEDGISVATASDVWPAPGEGTEPTCEEPGTKTYTGLETGEEIEVVTPALGHEWGEWTVTAPTPGVAGERTRECARCHETETERLLYDGFYLLKGNTAWAIESINAADLFEDSTDGQKVLHATLATGDQIKVVHVESNVITGWYPDGEGTQYTVTDDYSGNVSIFFRDTYWNDWASFGGYFWINLDSHAMQVAFSTNLDLQSSTNLIYYVSKATIDAFTFDSFKLIVKRWEDENAEPIIDEIAPQAYGSSYYRFIYRNLPPDKLNDRMEAYVEGVKDGVTWKSNSSSTNAITYCFRQAGNTGNQTRIRRLCADLIQYADAAQRYTGHNLANLPMSDSRWTADIESCATQTTPELSSAAWTKTDIDGQTANFYQTVVDLSSRVQVNFYVQLNEGLNPSDLKAICSYKDANGNDKQVVITGAEWQTVSSTQRQYMIRFSALLPSELRSAITVIVEDGEQNQISNTYVRSVEAYAARALPSANAKLADLLVAVMNYGISAEKYVLNQN